MPQDAVLTLLRSVREVIQNPDKWTQRAAFRNENGESCAGFADIASFCLMGAMAKNSPALSSFATACHLVSAVIRDRHPGLTGDIAAFNDAPERKHGEVLSVIDEAINRREDRVRTEQEEDVNA